MNTNSSKSYTHNLVNALYTMRGLLETCLDQEGTDEIEQKAKMVLKRAYGQADQALRIAKRLGALSIWQNGGKPQATRGKASLKQAWRNSLDTLRQEKGEFEKVEVMDRIPKDFPLIQCHVEDLREIFFHLVSNAVEAMKGEGKLIIRSQISFSTKEESFATIQVADTGPGIPGTLLPNIFLPFRTTKSFRKGNGLGLYLTHQLVRRNGGRITASSFLGTGTTFTLEFPLAKRRDS